MPAVYLASTALQQLRAAQAALEQHIIASSTGCCLHCGHDWPCAAATDATRTFTRYGQLPRRTPGATRPELINARRLEQPEKSSPTRWV